jgi:anti-sigma B factor antagonist
MSGELDLVTARHGSCAVIRVGGEVDLGTASALGDAAVSAMHDIGPNIVLDLTDVAFMDSTGLKVLLAIHKRAQLAGGRLVLACAPRPVTRVVTITGLDQTFAVCDTVERALSTCRDAPPDAAAAE